MGTKIFKVLEQHIPVNTTGVFVEIGSDRYEGSTEILANLAKQHNTKLITVDVSDFAKHQLEDQFDNIEFVIQTGSEWAEKFAQTHTDIAVIFLDNFDYIYEINDVNLHIQKQIDDYAKSGVVMNNVNCQIEHLKQLLALVDLFHQDTVIIFDDTYKINDCWVGKCGPCVVYLLCHGYEVLEHTTDCGVIMKKAINV